MERMMVWGIILDDVALDEGTSKEVPLEKEALVVEGMSKGIVSEEEASVVGCLDMGVEASAVGCLVVSV